MRQVVFLAYKIICSANGKVYIGVTKRGIAARWADHKEALTAGRPNKLYNAMRKHGLDSFTIEHCASASSKDDIFALEQLLIAQERSFHRGYNMTIGGDGPKGLTHSKESRERMRISQTGKKRSPEAVEKTAIANRGRKFPPRSAEWCAKIGAKTKGRKWSPEMREKMDGRFKGRIFSDEWRAKISAAKKGKGPSLEQRAAHSIKMKGKKYPPRTAEHSAALVASRARKKLERAEGNHPATIFPTSAKCSIALLLLLAGCALKPVDGTSATKSENMPVLSTKPVALVPNGKIGVDLNGPFYCATHADKPICRKVGP